MADKTLQTKIQLRNDTASNWTASNPILLKGEIGIESDTKKYKIGDGTTRWNSLSYALNTLPYLSLDTTQDDTFLDNTGSFKIPEKIHKNVKDGNGDTEVYLEAAVDNNFRPQVTTTGTTTTTKPLAFKSELDDLGTSLSETFTDTKNGLVPAPTSTNTSKFLKGDGTWDIPTDEKVKQKLVGTTGVDETYPLLFSSADTLTTTGTTSEIYGDSTITVNPNTDTINAKYFNIVGQGSFKGKLDKTLTIKTADGTTTTFNNSADSTFTLPDYALKTEISSVYNVKGSCTSTVLLAKNLASTSDVVIGDVWNITDTLTITTNNVSKFISATSGQSYPAGTNVVCVEDSGSKKWDILGGVQDLSSYANKIETISYGSTSNKFTIDTNKNVNIPLASTSNIGLIRTNYNAAGEDVANKYAVSTDTSGDAYVEVSKASSTTWGVIKTGLANDNANRKYGVQIETSATNEGKTYVIVPVATASVPGVMAATDKSKLDGIEANANNYTLPVATSTILGGIKSQTTGTTANRYYNINVDSNGLATVNVPWTDTNTSHTHTQATTSGLTITGSGGTSGTVSLAVNTSYTTSGKNYKVAIDSTTGGLYTNIPWTDVNVLQSATSTETDLPVLLTGGNGSNNYTGSALKSSKVTIQPSSGTLTSTKIITENIKALSKDFLSHNFTTTISNETKDTNVSLGLDTSSIAKVKLFMKTSGYTELGDNDDTTITRNIAFEEDVTQLRTDAVLYADTIVLDCGGAAGY